MQAREKSKILLYNDIFIDKILNATGATVTVTQYDMIPESEIIIPINKTNRLAQTLIQKWFPENVAWSERDIAVTYNGEDFQVTNSVLVYQTLINQSLNRLNYQGFVNNSGFSRLAAKIANATTDNVNLNLNANTDDQYGLTDQMLSWIRFDTEVKSFSDGSNKVKVENNDYIRNNWKFNPKNDDYQKSDSVRLRHGFYNQLIVDERIDPHFISSYLFNEYIYDLRRQDQTSRTQDRIQTQFDQTVFQTVTLMSDAQQEKSRSRPIKMTQKVQPRQFASHFSDVINNINSSYNTVEIRPGDEKRYSIPGTKIQFNQITFDLPLLLQKLDTKGGATPRSDKGGKHPNGGKASVEIRDDITIFWNRDAESLTISDFQGDNLKINPATFLKKRETVASQRSPDSLRGGGSDTIYPSYICDSKDKGVIPTSHSGGSRDKGVMPPSHSGGSRDKGVMPPTHSGGSRDKGVIPTSHSGGSKGGWRVAATPFELKFNSLSGYYRYLKYFGLAPADSVAFSSDTSAKFDSNLWYLIRDGLNDSTSRIRRKISQSNNQNQRLTMPMLIPDDIWKTRIARQSLEQIYKPKTDLSNLDNLQLKVLLESTWDNGRQYYQRFTNMNANALIGFVEMMGGGVNGAGVGANSRLIIPTDAPSSMYRYNNYNRLNGSKSHTLIVPKQDEEPVEFDRFPGFDKNSRLKFSGINLVANWERNKNRFYRKNQPTYEGKFENFQYINNLVSKFLKKTVDKSAKSKGDTNKWKITNEQINSLLWECYTELKRLPLDQLKSQALSDVNKIEGLENNFVIYLYYFVTFHLTVVTKVFVRLFELMAKKKIAVKSEDLLGFLKEEQTIGSEIRVSEGEVLSNILFKSNNSTGKIPKTVIEYFKPSQIYGESEIWLTKTLKSPLYYDSAKPDQPTVNLINFYLNELKIISDRREETLSSAFTNQKINIVLGEILNMIRNKSSLASTTAASGASAAAATDKATTSSDQATNLKYQIFGHYNSKVIGLSLNFENNILELENLLMLYSVFSLVFLKGSGAKMSPVSWGNNYKIDIANFKKFKAELMVDTKHYLKLEDVIDRNFPIKTDSLLVNINKTTEKLPKIEERQFKSMDRIKRFNLNFQNFYYDANPDRDTAQQTLAGEFITTVGTTCDKMYSFSVYDQVARAKTSHFREFLQQHSIINGLYGDHSLRSDLYQIDDFTKMINATADVKPPLEQLQLDDVQLNLSCRVSKVVETRDEDVGQTSSSLSSSTTSSQPTSTRLALSSLQSQVYERLDKFIDQLNFQWTDDLRGYNVNKIFNKDPDDLTNPMFIRQIGVTTVDFNFESKIIVSVGGGVSVVSGVNLNREIPQLYDSSIQFVGRLIRYFQYWRDTTKYPTESTQIQFGNDRLLQREYDMKISQDPSQIQRYLKELARRLVQSEIQTAINDGDGVGSDGDGDENNEDIYKLALDSFIRHDIKRNEFVGYIPEMEKEINHFSFTRSEHRRMVREDYQLKLLQENSNLRRVMRNAPQHMKSKKILTEIYGVAD